MLRPRHSAAAAGSKARRYLPAIIALVAVGTLLLPASRHRILRTVGWSLVAADPLTSAEVIVVSVDAGLAGVLEAADLVREGLAPRVALLAEVATPGEREFARRGVAYEGAAAASARYLKTLGVSEVELIPASVDGTQSQGGVLREWCVRRQVRSVIVVSSADHSRRLRRVLRRSMRGSPARVLVRSSRFSSFNPDSWWLTRAGIRTQIVETEKLLLDITTHPLS
jgi:uncharacterized SAM-binding protein YcdF (DUF218 family)